MKCTTDYQCEPEETDSEQPSPIISTSSSYIQAIESIHQLMQSCDNDDSLQQLEDFIKKKIFDACKQCRVTYLFSSNV